MQVLKPTWSSWSLLVYTGGLTILGAAVAALAYLSTNYGDFAYVAWSLLLLAVILVVARHLRRDHPVAAGVFAFVAVPLFAAFLGALWTWWGWSLHGGSPVAGFHISRLGLYLLVLLFATGLVRRFRAPFGVTWVLLFKWLFVVDFVSSGGNWSAWVSIILGFAFLIAGMTYDSGERRPYGFWLHVAAGLAIGAGFLSFWHSGNWHWGFIAVLALIFIRVAVATNRSSWALLGAAGILMAATHYTVEWWHRGLPVIGGTPGAPRGWVPPLVFGITGFVLVLLGFAVSRRERR